MTQPEWVTKIDISQLSNDTITIAKVIFLANLALFLPLLLSLQGYSTLGKNALTCNRNGMGPKNKFQ